ncbi:uncharacterized protein LOC118439322 [Folsomia candida]|uniref:uncharacterized protein LOC118439322 n=1 Tax=Folsomia candida TaxID=158441 RepID=UPI0016053E84|nr:uncharacterized protein LOC118439322 [Folsomia candida]
MESQLEERTPLEIALNNPTILSEIFKRIHSDIDTDTSPLKTARLVCQFWNDMVLSLAKLELELSNYEHYGEQDPFSFFDFCFSVDHRLAKRIHATSGYMVSESAGPRVYHFACKLTHVCDKFSEIMRILTIEIMYEDCLKYVHQILKNCCPNLKELELKFFLSTLERTLDEPLPPKAKLESLIFHCGVHTGIPALVSFIQVVVNASPNLRKAKFPEDIFPDLKSCKFLNSLKIKLTKSDPADIARCALMLRPISGRLVSLRFGKAYSLGPSGEPGKFWLPKNMRKLETYKAPMVDVFQCDELLSHFEKMPALKTLVIRQIRHENGRFARVFATRFRLGEDLRRCEEFDNF